MEYLMQSQQLLPGFSSIHAVSKDGYHQGVLEYGKLYLPIARHNYSNSGWFALFCPAL